MAPLTTLPPCSEVLLNISTSSSATALNLTMSKDDDLDSDDLSALLYIVVTLLFYSMGIVVGIITYLKRERADMEEEKVFDMYLSMKRDPFNLHRQERVRQTAQFLRKLEMAKEAERLEKERLAALQVTPTPTQQDLSQEAVDSDVTGSESGNSPRRGKRSKHVKISDCVPLRSPSSKPGGHGTSLSCTAGGEDEDEKGGRMGHEAGAACVSGVSVYPLVISTAQTMVGSSTARPPPVAFYPPPPPPPHHHHHGYLHGASSSSEHPLPNITATELKLPPQLQQRPQTLPPTPVTLPSRPITATANVSGGVAALTLVTPKPPEHERRGALPMGAKALHAPEDPKGETMLLTAGPPLAEPLSRRSTDKGFCPSIARVLDL